MGRKLCAPRSTAVLDAVKVGLPLDDFPAEEVLEACDKFGSTALHWACGMGRLHAARELVERGMDPSALQSCGNRRSPLHFAARNGHLEVCVYLVEECGCDPDILAAADVTPFQLAAWQLQMPVLQYLAPRIQLHRSNAYQCYASHWVALAPSNESIVDVAKWLKERCGPGMWQVRNAQGHTPLHKAAFAGHIPLCEWLRDDIGLLDDRPDDHGNFAADLAREAGRVDVAEWLAQHASPTRAADLRTLGINDDDPTSLRRAFYKKAREVHPDKNANGNFDVVRAAYARLTGLDCAGNANPLRDPANLRLLLANDDDTVCSDAAVFEARLAVILLEQPNGLPLSQLRKRFRRTWGDDVPDLPLKKKSASLVDIVRTYATRVARIEYHTQVILYSKLDRSDVLNRLLLLRDDIDIETSPR